MNEAIEYRSLAAQMRREAMASLLPRVRELKLSAADRWDVLAAELEHFSHSPLASPAERAAWIF